MRFDWLTFALQAVNFAILVWLLHRFLYQPVLRMVDARRQEVDRRFEEAGKIDADAQAKLAAIAAERAGIAAERAAALQAAAGEAEAAAEGRRQRAERDAAALLESARKTLAAEREAAAAEARRISLELGVDIARRLLTSIPAELRAEAWLEGVEGHLASLGAAERKAMLDGLAGDGAIEVVTAGPMSDAVMAEWRGRLPRALGDGIAVTFSVDPALLAGAELHFPSAILRFSWRNELASLSARIEDHEHAR